MVQSLDDSPFSDSFNKLVLMAVWTIKPGDEIKDRWYAIAKSAMALLSFTAIVFLTADLWEVFGDVQKTSWNLCITTLFTGGWMKSLLILFKFPVINDLRRKLHEDAESRTLSHHLVINGLALREFRFLKILLYTACCFIIPVWLVSRYMTTYTNSRELPLPMRFPFSFDKRDEVQYHVMYVWVSCLSIFGVYFVVQGELCMFSFLIQITREYWILMRDISLLGDLKSEFFQRESVSSRKEEINPILKNTKIKNYLKYIYRRQQTLIQYTESFELCYSIPMILQILTASTILTVIGIQLILIPLEFSGFVLFQIGYISVVLMDYFLVCWFATRLKSLCYKVGEIAYDSLWYKMEVDCQKDLTMLIMRSQHPPRITTGNLMEVNLNAFIHAMRNIYSWLTLFRGLKVKGT